MNFSSLRRVAVSAYFLLFSAYAMASPPAVSYHLVNKVPLAAASGGGEYFDYVTVKGIGKSRRSSSRASIAPLFRSS